MRFFQFVVPLIVLILPAYVYTYNCDELYSNIIPCSLKDSNQLNGTWYQLQKYGEDKGSPVCETVQITPTDSTGKTFLSSATLVFNNGIKQVKNENGTFVSTGEANVQQDSGTPGVPNMSIPVKRVIFIAVKPLYYMSFSCVKGTPSINVRTRSQSPTIDTWGEIFTLVSLDFNLDTLWMNTNCQAVSPLQFPYNEYRSTVDPWEIIY